MEKILSILGHLLNSRSIRLGWIITWWDQWFVNKRFYCELLYMCFRLRFFLMYLLFDAYVIKKVVRFYSHFEMTVHKKRFIVKFFYYDGNLSEDYFEFIDKVNARHKFISYRKNKLQGEKMRWKKKVTPYLRFCEEQYLVAHGINRYKKYWSSSTEVFFSLLPNYQFNVDVIWLRKAYFFLLLHIQENYSEIFFDRWMLRSDHKALCINKYKQNILKRKRLLKKRYYIGNTSELYKKTEKIKWSYKNTFS